MVSQKLAILKLIESSISKGAPLEDCCKAIGISKRTIQRWRGVKNAISLEDKRSGPKKHSNALTTKEEAEAFEVLTSQRFMDKSPYFIVAILADEGKYICSESTLYRILRKHTLNAHRGRYKRPTYRKLKPLKAIRPNEIWTWDISYLNGPSKRKYFYLYMFIDIFSRKIIGWEIHENECSIKASNLVEKLIIKEKVRPGKLRIHSDNGAPMKSSPMVNLLEELNVSKSYSRARVCDDNPFSESLFKTIKYSPTYPDKNFKSIDEARNWVKKFVHWYNTEHKHSKIGYVTPNQRHNNFDRKILERRRQVFFKAMEKKTLRFNGKIKSFERIEEVSLTGYRTS